MRSRVLDPQPFYADLDPDPGVEIFADSDPDLGIAFTCKYSFLYVKK